MYHGSKSELGAVVSEPAWWEKIIGGATSVVTAGATFLEKNAESAFDIYNKMQQLKMVKQQRAATQRRTAEVEAMRRIAYERQMESVRMQSQRTSIPIMQRLGLGGGNMVPIMLGVGGLGIVAMFLLKPKRG